MVKQKQSLTYWKKNALKYEKGFNILIDYFDSISDEEKPKVNRRLNKIGL